MFLRKMAIFWKKDKIGSKKRGFFGDIYFCKLCEIKNSKKGVKSVIFVDFGPFWPWDPPSEGVKTPVLPRILAFLEKFFFSWKIVTKVHFFKNIRKTLKSSFLICCFLSSFLKEGKRSKKGQKGRFSLIYMLLRSFLPVWTLYFWSFWTPRNS